MKPWGCYCASAVSIAVGSQPVRRVYWPVGSEPPCLMPVQTLTTMNWLRFGDNLKCLSNSKSFPASTWICYGKRSKCPQNSVVVKCFITGGSGPVYTRGQRPRPACPVCRLAHQPQTAAPTFPPDNPQTNAITAPTRLHRAVGLPIQLPVPC